MLVLVTLVLRLSGLGIELETPAGSDCAVF
jgi:hypothetical protein